MLQETSDAWTLGKCALSLTEFSVLRNECSDSRKGLLSLVFSLVSKILSAHNLVYVVASGFGMLFYPGADIPICSKLVLTCVQPPETSNFFYSSLSLAEDRTFIKARNL